jgi:hypothetical protein
MAPEDTSETGVIRNTLASSQFFRMLGVDSEDLGRRFLMSCHNTVKNRMYIKRTIFFISPDNSDNLNSSGKDSYLFILLN